MSGPRLRGAWPPFGGVFRGWSQIAEALDRVAATYREGEYLLALHERRLPDPERA